MQAEIWRAASHSRFYARYFRVFSGFLGLKSFLNFFKKRVLGPIFAPQSSFEGARRVALASPLHALHPKVFEDFFFLLRLPAARESGSRTARQPGSQVAGSPSSHLGKDHKTLTPPRASKAKTCQNFWRQRKSPEANLGALVERLTRLELATSTLARWCSTN